MAQTKEEFDYRSWFDKQMSRILLTHWGKIPYMALTRTGGEHAYSRTELKRLQSQARSGDKRAFDKVMEPDLGVLYSWCDVGRFSAEAKFMGSEISRYKTLRTLREAQVDSDTVDMTDFFHEHSGYVEDKAWCHYVDLVDRGRKVAMIFYVAWMPERLFMDWVDQPSQYVATVAGFSSNGGSDEPIARLHLGRFKTMAQFLTQDLSMLAGKKEQKYLGRTMAEMGLYFCSESEGLGSWTAQVRGTAFADDSLEVEQDQEWLERTKEEAEEARRKAKAKHANKTE